MLLFKVEPAGWTTPPGGVPTNSCRANRLKSFRTQNDRLSAWEAGPGNANVHRLVAALAACRNHLQGFTYALIARSTLVEIGVGIQSTPGATPDREANADWHYNVGPLTAHQVAEIATLAPNPTNVPGPTVERLIRAELGHRHLDSKQMSFALLLAVGRGPKAGSRPWIAHHLDHWFDSLRGKVHAFWES